MREEKRNNYRRCLICGAEIDSGSHYCDKCGRQIHEGQSDFPKQVVKPDKVKVVKSKGGKLFDKIIIGLLVVTLIFILGVSVVFLSKRQVKPVDTGVGNEIAVDQEDEAQEEIRAMPENHLGKGGIKGPDLIGEALWMKALGNSIVSAPVYGDGIVYVVVEDARETQVPNSEEGFIQFITRLHAIEAITGRTIWVSENFGIDRTSYSEILSDGGCIYVVAGSKDIGVLIVGYNASGSGEKLWPEDCFIDASRTVGAAMSGDVIAVCDISRAGRYELHGVGASSGRHRWHISLPGRTSPPSSFNGYLSYIGKHPGDASQPMFISNAWVEVLSGPAGLTVFRKELGFSDIWSAPVLVGEKIIAAGQWAAGRLLVECYDINEPGGSPLWQWDAWLAGEEEPPAGVVVVDGKCIIPGPGGTAVILGVEDGTSNVSEFTGGDSIIYPPVSNGNQVYFAMEGGVVALSTEDGSVAWYFGFPDGFQPKALSNLAYGGGRLFCPGRSGLLLAIE